MRSPFIHHRQMATRHPTSFSSSQRPSNSQPTRLPPSNAPKPSTSQPHLHRPSQWQSQPIDLETIEIVDLTDAPSSRPPRRPLENPSPSSRPTKRNKGKDPEVYISLEDEEVRGTSPTNPINRQKSPSQSGTLSAAKCVICLDSPTDLAATPCGMSTYDLADCRTFIL
jgi:hypothetical protein